MTASTRWLVGPVPDLLFGCGAIYFGFFAMLAFAGPEVREVFPPELAPLLSGQTADKLILVALDDEVFATLFRARALMAQLTVSVRSGGFFRAQELQSVATFYDMLQLLQFDTLVISDGKNWSHRIDFKRE